MFIFKCQQNSGSHKFISAGVNKMVDFINLFLLESTKQWIPFTYFCSNQQKVDSIICFHWSQQNHNFISAIATIFQEVDLVFSYHY